MSIEKGHLIQSTRRNNFWIARCYRCDGPGELKGVQGQSDTDAIVQLQELSWRIQEGFWLCPVCANTSILKPNQIIYLVERSTIQGYKYDLSPKRIRRVYGDERYMITEIHGGHAQVMDINDPIAILHADEKAKCIQTNDLFGFRVIYQKQESIA